MSNRAFALGVALAALLAVRGAKASAPVDVELVLAVDVSLSMAEDETRLQRNGYARALRDPAVLAAIRSGKLGRIAVSYVEWSSVTDQRIVVDWRIVSDAQSAEQFASALDRAPLHTGTTTSISAGIAFAAARFAESGLTAERRIIDVSGDGYSDFGPPIHQARDSAVAAGIIINGLPVMNARPPWREPAPPDLDRYYADNVIGGPGAFSLVVRDLKDFGSAVVRKLVLEIASRPMRRPAG
jgi:hypothetical protein